MRPKKLVWATSEVFARTQLPTFFHPQFFRVFQTRWRNIKNSSQEAMGRNICENSNQGKFYRKNPDLGENFSNQKKMKFLATSQFLS